MKTPDGIPAEWIDTSPLNSYDERVVAHVIESVSRGGIRFRCKDQYWDVAFKAWVRSRRDNAEIPEPMSPGHCMFLTPTHYGCVPWGVDVPQRAIRRAIRGTVVANLDGWDREMRKSWEGMRQLAKIVRHTVDAKLAGRDTGASEYVACIMSMC